MKTTEEKMAVMAAYVNGKEIECRFTDVNCNDNHWEYVQDPTWDWKNYDYRIKPKPNYQPYQSITEIMVDMKLHGPMIVGLKDGMYFNILATDGKSIAIYDGCEAMETAMDEYQWQDGAIFGREIK